MTHTSTEQERDLKDIEQALRLVREAHQHEVDAYRPELYKPECDRRPKPQLDRLGDLICLLQNILYAAQQASRRAQVVPKGWKLVPEESTEAMARAFRADDAPYYFAMTTIRCNDFAERYRAALAAAPQPPEAAPSSVSNGRWPDAPPQENIRGGAPYSDPEFEKLAREHAVWGTAQSALCAQFWLAALAQRVPLSDAAIHNTPPALNAQVLPEKIPSSDTLWQFLTKGVSLSALHTLSEHDQNVYRDRAAKTWATIRSEATAASQPNEEA